MKYQFLHNPLRIHWWDDEKEGFIQYDKEEIKVSRKIRGQGYRWKITCYCKDDPDLTMLRIVQALRKSGFHHVSSGYRD